MTELLTSTSPSRLVARSAQNADLWPHLHEHLLAACHGVSSVLLQFEPSGEQLRATSGYNVDALPLDAWVPSELERAAARQAEASGDLAVLASLADAPALQGLLGTPAAVLVPLLGPAGLLGLALVGTTEPPSVAEIRERALAVGDACVLTIERLALQREAEQQRDLRDLLDAFSRTATSTLDLHDALGAVCHAIARSFMADRVVAWLHDREARHLSLVASSDPRDDRIGTQVPSADAVSPAASALRSDRPELTPGAAADARTLAIPLRGRRRAIGTIVVERLPIEPGTELQILERGAELGRQLAAAIENVLLLEQVLQSRRELGQAEKLAALGQFVAGIAHEVNNPLQGVLGHLDLVAAAPGLRPAVKQDLRKAAREAERAAAIVRSLLLFSGTRRITARRVRVALVLGRIAALRARPLARAGIRLERTCAPDLPEVSGDPVLLQQALLNIVVNAEQALGGPGLIHVHAMRHGLDAVRIVIEDSGPGIPADVLPRVFEPFFTTKEVGNGTGLGLAIAYGILKEHGGSLAAANGPVRGAVFTLTLPAHPPSRPEGTSRARRADKRPKR